MLAGRSEPLAVRPANLERIKLYVLMPSHVASPARFQSLLQALGSLRRQEAPAYEILLSWYIDDWAMGTPDGFVPYSQGLVNVLSS